MDLDATPGGASANSYVTVEAATAFLEGRLHPEPWYVWDPTRDFQSLVDRRVAALVSATRLLDTMVRWHGRPTTLTQALAWPMTGHVDAYGRAVDPTTVPLVIQQATALYALALLRDQSETATVQAQAHIKSRRLGETTVVYQDQGLTTPASHTIPADVRHLLQPYGTMAGSVMVPLLRT